LILSSVPTLNISTVLFRKYVKKKYGQSFEKKRPTGETEEYWNLEENDGRSYETDVDKKIFKLFFSR
jgi:hypothetical protein